MILLTPEGRLTDHINRNKLDNRVENLRVVDAAENALNRTISQNTRYHGITRSGEFYVASFRRGCISRQKCCLTFAEAKAWRDRWEIQFYSEYAPVPRQLSDKEMAEIAEEDELRILL